MKRLLSLIAMIGIILAIAAPMGAMAADEIIGYEFNGTKEGWISLDSNASINAATVSGATLKLSTSSSYMDRDIVYNGVADWGKAYTFSFDLDILGNSGKAQILFNNTGTATVANRSWNNHHLDIGLKSESTGLASVVLYKESDYNGRNQQLATADFSSVSDEYKTAINNTWHVEIVYNYGDVAVWMKPLNYSGDAVKVIDYDETATTCKTGRIGIRNNQLYNKCNITNIKVEKTIAETASYDYNWNGSDEGWRFYTGTNGKGAISAQNGTLAANGCSYSGNTFATYDAVKWSGDTTIKCYMQAFCPNTGSSVSVCFNRKDDNNCYKLEIAGRQTAILRQIVNGTTAKELGKYTDDLDSYFYHGDLEISYADGKINVWFTPTNGTRKQIFTDITDPDSKYTEGTVSFIVKTEGYSSMPTLFKNISISGNFTASNEICTAQVSGVQKLSNGTITPVEFSGTGFEAEAGATLTNDMDLKVPVRYAKASGDVTAAVLVAYYGTDDMMLDVELTKVPLSSANREWIDVPIGKAMPSGTTKVRCFVWNASTICPALELSHAN